MRGSLPARGARAASSNNFAGAPPIEEIFAMQTVLRGRDLACWCPLDRPCHADILLELANKGDE
ncbi:hypothetical protein Salmuc_02429 [Salipiger mucosus DSM 16094]|uniref:DUF4326 domain-containing protein n=1 Tax=Salipiger mucosus DSM 16094 TaxID=1123237 RepID=S9QQZ5_9RHOB|nr:hypothetical protein Salmuc_02429 [Salipiger mucosus DSM 16094]